MGRIRLIREWEYLVHFLEKAMAPHSSTLAWKIPWTEEPWAALSRKRLSDFTFTFHFHALEKEMATHSSVLAWRIPGTGEPGGLLSMGSHRVGHDWSDLAAAAAAAAVHFWICSLDWLQLWKGKIFNFQVFKMYCHGRGFYFHSSACVHPIIILVL